MYQLLIYLVLLYACTNCASHTMEPKNVSKKYEQLIYCLYCIVITYLFIFILILNTDNNTSLRNM